MSDHPPTSSGQSASASKPWEHAKSGQGSGADPLATRFVSSLAYDFRLYRHDITGSVAHARMLNHTGLITADELQQIEGGLNEILTEIEAAQAQTGSAAGWSGWKEELEDVHMCIEAALIEKTGDAGRKLHTGRSRNDQVALDLKLWIKDTASELQEKINVLSRAFVTLAKRDGRVVMPSYTHFQRAQPIVVGAELLAWVSAIDRSRDRLASLWTVNQKNPLGSGAIAGTGLPIDRNHTAEALQIGGPTGSSIDATASRDVAIDFVYALSMTAMTLSRWAEQWVIYSSTEFGFVRLDDRYTTGSSMMPQKANPDMLELIRGRCGTVYGHLVALMTICKGLGIGYQRDLQEDKRHVFGAYDTLVDCVDMAAKIVETTRFDEAIIKVSLDRGFLDATSLAECLVTRGVPFRTSHQIVATLVKKCQEQGLNTLEGLKPNDFDHACRQAGADACGDDVYEWLGARRVVDRYISFGSAGVKGFEQQLVYWQQRLTDHTQV